MGLAWGRCGVGVGSAWVGSAWGQRGVSVRAAWDRCPVPMGTEHTCACLLRLSSGPSTGMLRTVQERRSLSLVSPMFSLRRSRMLTDHRT